MELIRSLMPERSLIRIELDNGEKYWLSREAVLEGDLKADSEVDLKEFRHFVLMHQYPAALNRAVAMLARRACSRGEIEQKLQAAHYSSKTVDLVLYKLEKEGLLNDLDFAEQWVRYRASGCYGSRKIYQELRSKGISEEYARNALKCLDEENQMQHAVHLAEKGFARIRADDDPRKALQKVMQSLVRRGFDWDTAKAACERVLKT